MKTVWRALFAIIVACFGVTFAMLIGAGLDLYVMAHQITQPPDDVMMRQYFLCGIWLVYSCVLGVMMYLCKQLLRG